MSIDKIHKKDTSQFARRPFRYISVFWGEKSKLIITFLE
nr:MAG TPA: hypothetical protein [Caudoviricetes sp.]